MDTKGRYYGKTKRRNNMKPKKVLLAANADTELAESIKKEATKTNRSKSKMIITILEDYFKRENYGKT